MAAKAEAIGVNPGRVGITKAPLMVVVSVSVK